MMNIIVFVKQVPDTSEVKIDSKTNNLVREGVPSIINPYDENGVEAALALRDRIGGKVTVVSMGPMQASSTLEYCLAMGADEAVLVSDRLIGGSDTLATGYTLSEVAKKIGYDLIVCGNEAIDGCTGQVGPIIAENLDIPQFTYVREVQVEADRVTVQREVGKNIEFYEAQLPALVCVLKGVNQPRRLGQTDKEVKLLRVADLDLDPAKIGNDGSPTKVVNIKMSDARAKSYVTIDDSLSAEDRIKMIINGGIEKKEKIDLWRGTAEALADRLMEHAGFNRYIV
ncbi:MAG: electron transfer flavoprotein subunit beta/FixA family protein [Christensenella sp.]|uniref:electron transfer flavoprotein subunit beta/FixA family protein n=1 Tax=Christensenella sp. TaxID=1935934 RepID=UPI002B1F4C35|nr:electron transfer flavoprotein subunit beta/FixA family protein [Christensenella sp.]MEA5004079.1 electron transfer flavoprotein subunit beta/FixA family protein [Christensenella sp.]